MVIITPRSVAEPMHEAELRKKILVPLSRHLKASQNRVVANDVVLHVVN